GEAMGAWRAPGRGRWGGWGRRAPAGGPRRTPWGATSGRAPGSSSSCASTSRARARHAPHATGSPKSRSAARAQRAADADWTQEGDSRAPRVHAKVRYRCSLPGLAGFASPRYPDPAIASLHGGGEGGIRTLGTVSGTHAFQACTFGHSVTSPKSPGDRVYFWRRERDSTPRYGFPYT